MNTKHSSSPLRIANTQAFWGDRNDAAAQLLEQVPDLDYLTLDYLAEVSLSILAQQRARDPHAGFPKDFLELFESLIPYWKNGGRCKLITNAGGLDPHACAKACAAKLEQHGAPSLKIGVVAGDDVLHLLQDTSHVESNTLFRHLESRRSLDEVRPRLVTANAYLGAAPIVDALAQGADIVLTGRVADPSLTVAACVHHFGWAANDWNRWAAATVAGHLIECGVQVTGGISTDWLQIPNPASIGFPIVEMHEDGRFVVTKPEGTGGAVTIPTVTEQLLYEIGDPGNYLSPDLKVSFLNLQLEQVGTDRVQVSGAVGSPPTPTYKVSATYRDGYRAAGLLTIFGHQAAAKAQRCGEIVLARMLDAGMTWRDAVVEIIGAGGCADGIYLPPYITEAKEVAFRVAMEADDKGVIEHFTRQMIPLVTAGPQGTTGYSEGRPRVHPIFRYWPCLISREHVKPTVDFVVSNASNAAACETISKAERPEKLNVFDDHWPTIHSQSAKASGARITHLRDIAYARSGDKGTMANIGIALRNSQDYARLKRWLTSDRVATYLSPIEIQTVERFELPNLHAFNFLVHGILSRGLRCDAQGKALGQVLLEMPLDPSYWQGGEE